MAWYGERSHQEYAPDLTSHYPAIYCPDTWQVLHCTPWRTWMLCKPSCPQSSQSNLQFHSIIRNKSSDWSVWRLQILRDDWNNSIKLAEFSCVTIKYQVKYDIDFWRQSLVPSPAELPSPSITLVMCALLAFRGRWLEPADVRSRKDHILVSGGGFPHPEWSNSLNTKLHISRAEKSRGKIVTDYSWITIISVIFTASGDFLYQLTPE